MINDELLAAFFMFFNFMIGQIITVIRYYIGFNILFYKEYEFISGQFSLGNESR